LPPRAQERRMKLKVKNPHTVSNVHRETRDVSGGMPQTKRSCF
jgi:hypothetical protein